jgi:phosphoglycerate kinase
VNDAFGTAHRAHASVAAITECLPSVAGLLMEREVEYLEKVTVNPERPLGLVFGGAKMSDKILILENLLDKADVICVGGGMANTFLKAQGHDVARSLVEDDRLDVARDILDRVAQRPELTFVLPSDVVVSIGDPQEWNVRSVPVSEVPTGWRILDVGHETIEDFRAALEPVRTAMWNGPLGLFEQARFAEGSLALAHIFADINATTVIGGGETAAVATRAGVAERISHISTGGGASLEMLEGHTLPGVAALLDR